MYGYIQAAAISPRVRVAAPRRNAEEIVNAVLAADKAGVTVAVFPELCVTGYTCGELFLQRDLLDASDAAVKAIAESTRETGTLFFIGAPLRAAGKLYNAAVAVCRGRILGAVPKTYLPDYGEFYEARHFSPAPPHRLAADIGGVTVPLGTDLLFAADNMPELTVAAEICEDLWAPEPPSGRAARAGATVLCNLSASNETIGKAEWRRTIVAAQSGRCEAVYIYADAGEGESTTDLVFGAHNLIAETGRLAAESVPFGSGIARAAVDLEKAVFERRRLNTFTAADGYERIPFVAKTDPFDIGPVGRTPFVPSDPSERRERARSVLEMQARALARRLDHTGAEAVIGVSGGLDSSLALLVIRRAYAILKRKPAGITAVTMPCFGTTGRTFDNARALIRAVGATERVVPIAESVRRHFADIGHDESVMNAAYENAQARERTQVLMDIANDVGGLVVGTGDLSELALGWATYNGDQMSMYGVNASVPKTLVRYLIAAVADEDKKLRPVLGDILDTEISPELLPPSDGRIAQKTEEILGSYELNDFFLYYTVRYGFGREKILFLAGKAFPELSAPALTERLDFFYRRFVTQQFKRSAMPDGVKVGSVALSPRGDWRMPSDSDYKP